MLAGLFFSLTFFNLSKFGTLWATPATCGVCLLHGFSQHLLHANGKTQRLTSLQLGGLISRLFWYVCFFFFFFGGFFILGAQLEHILCDFEVSETENPGQVRESDSLLAEAPQHLGLRHCADLVWRLPWRGPRKPRRTRKVF